MQNSAHTSLPRTRLAALSISAAGAALAALPQAALAGIVAPDSGATPTGDSISTVYLIVAVIGVLTLLTVIGAIFSAVRGPAAESAGSGSVKPVVIGSAILALAFSALGGFTLSNASNADESADGASSSLKAAPFDSANLKTGNTIDAPKGPSIAVQVNGQQFLWRYSYLGKNVYSYHDFVVPVGVTVLLYVTSSDVEHNWWVPQLGPPVQAIPGYVNMGWIRADEEGTFNGASTVFSGTNYQNMTTRVIAKPAGEFDSWLKQKETELKASALGLTEQKAAAEGAAK